MDTILTLTMNPAIDKNTEVDRVIDEHKLRCEPPTREPGGGGINVSRAIQRLGGQSIAYYAGGGLTARILQNLLDKEHLEHRLLEIEGWIRENLNVYESSTDRQYRFGMPGPVFREQEWRRCLDELSNISTAPAYIVASGSLSPGLPVDFYSRVGRIAKQLGARFVLDTSGEALHEGIQEGAYLIKPNLRELEAVSGRKIESEADQEDAARMLIEEGKCEVVVASMGAQGALFQTRKVTERLRAPTVPIRSRVGAGDSMVAGIVTALTRGMAIERAVRYGVAAGTAAVMTPGTELCRRDDTERLFRQLL